MAEEQEGKQLAHYEPMSPARSSIQLVLERWDYMKQVAQTFLNAKGFLPDHIKSEAEALAVMIKGAEIDVPFTEALNFIYPVRGRTACMGQLILGLLQKGGFVFKQHQISKDGAKVTGMHPVLTAGKYVSTEFTREDAQDAGLIGEKDKEHTWAKYTKDMMFWRAVGRFGKQYAPGITGGLILLEELGVPVTINEAGEQVLDGDIEIDSAGSEIPLMRQDQLNQLMHLVGEEDFMLFAEFLFARGSIEFGERGDVGFLAMKTLLEPVAEDLIVRWEQVQLEFEAFLEKRKKESIAPETFEAFRQDLIDAGYKLFDSTEEDTKADEMELRKEKKEQIDALAKEHGLDGSKLKKWLNEKTRRFAGKIKANNFKHLSYTETSLDVLQDILDTKDTWLPLAKKAGLEKKSKK